ACGPLAAGRRTLEVLAALGLLVHAHGGRGLDSGTGGHGLVRWHRPTAHGSILPLMARRSSRAPSIVSSGVGGRARRSFARAAAATTPAIASRARPTTSAASHPGQTSHSANTAALTRAAP